MKRNDSLEIYIIDLIKRRKQQLQELTDQKDATYNFGGIQSPIYTKADYWARFHSLSGSINDLYMCLTAHDNNYNEQNKK